MEHTRPVADDKAHSAGQIKMLIADWQLEQLHKLRAMVDAMILVKLVQRIETKQTKRIRSDDIGNSRPASDERGN